MAASPEDAVAAAVEVLLGPGDVGGGYLVLKLALAQIRQVPIMCTPVGA